MQRDHQEFRQEVRAFIAQNLTEEMREAGRLQAPGIHRRDYPTVGEEANQIDAPFRAEDS